MRYKNSKPRKLCYAAGWLLADGLKGLGYPKDVVRSFAYHANGKPYLRTMPEFPFNISHSKDMAVLALAQLPYAKGCNKEKRIDLKLGCDVEWINVQNHLQQERIARRFFTESEFSRLCELPLERQPEAFCRYWTRKESVLKLIGTGIALPMNVFDVGLGKEIIVDEKELEQWFGSLAEKKQAEFEPAVKILLGQKLYCHDFKYGGYCICVTETESIPVRLVPFAKKACNTDEVVVH